MEPTDDLLASQEEPLLGEREGTAVKTPHGSNSSSSDKQEPFLVKRDAEEEEVERSEAEEEEIGILVVETEETPLLEEDDLISNDDPIVIPNLETNTRPQRLQRIALYVLTAVVWSSGILFGLYMMGHYLIPVWTQDVTEVERQWNMALPHLYTTRRPLATLGMGLHFAGGSITIILGAIQLVGAVRHRFPAFHRWTGRLYVACSAMTAIGGLLYIWAGYGCIGGVTMDVAFSCCAFLTLLASVQTYRHAAITKRYALHKLWSWRLYSLMISSWMYRLEYATATVILNIPHDRAHYSYPLDYFMDFFFYVPNLILVEIIWRTRHKSKPAWVSYLITAVMIFAALLVLLTSLMNAVEIWIPGMLGHLDEDDDDRVDEF